MAATRHSLADLISGALASRKAGSPVVKAASHDVAGELLRGMLRKCAQEIVTHQVLPSGYVAPAELARRKRMQAAADAEKARMHGRTGNDAYDSLPDVARDRARANARRAYEEHAANNPAIVQRKDLATVMRENDAAGGVSNWGGSSVGKTVGGVLGAPVKGLTDAIASTVTYFTHAPKGTSFKDWQKQYWGTATKGYGDFAHAVANNFQLQADNARHGAASLGHLASRYLDVRSYGDSTRAKDLRRSYENARANEQTAYLDRQRRILGNFNDRDLKNPERSLLGMINYGANAGVGQFAGQSLAMAGAGTAAKGVSAGITRGTHALSGAIRGGSAGTTAATTAADAATAAQAGASAAQAGTSAASIGSRVVDGSRRMLANGVDAIGDTVSFPFRAAGNFADPVGLAAKGVTKGVPATGRALYGTLREGVRPVRDVWRVARNPHIVSDAWHAHPWQFAGQAARYPFQWAWNTGKPIGAPVLRAAFSKPGLEAQTVYGAARSAADGDYGDAAGQIGTMGMYGAAGSAAIPLLLLQSMYGGGSGDNDYQE